jgi:metal-dependent amidase/aminoacylase/carboxypeptidase family protein
MGVSMDPVMLGPELLAEAEARAEDLIAWRREFHQFPELAFEENITASRVSQPWPPPRGGGGDGFGVPTAVQWVLRGDHPVPPSPFVRKWTPGPEEETGLSFASSPRGLHACGHAAPCGPTGFAALLSQRRNL